MMSTKGNGSEHPSDRKKSRSSGAKRSRSGAFKTAHSALRTKLERAADGLEYWSESQYPFWFFTLPSNESSLTPEGFLSLLGLTESFLDDLHLKAVQFIEARSIDDFFKNSTDMSNPERVPEARRFKKLVSLLKKELQDVKVFRVGQVEIRCYIAGLDGVGEIVGLVTTAIET